MRWPCLPFILLLACCSRNTKESADLLIKNARVFTVDDSRPWAQAIAVKGDRILWVGENEGAGAFVSKATRVKDANGGFILPGFVDSHFHALLGSNPDVLRISNANSLQEILEQVADFSRSRPHLKWIEAEGWNYSAFPDGSLPSARDLEGVTSGHPAFLVAYDYHTVWLNQEAMNEFGITEKTMNVSFAEQVQKDRVGKPTGILIGFGSAGISDQAEKDLRNHLPSHSKENVYRGIRQNLNAAIRAGITTVVEPQSSLEDVEVYQHMQEKKEIPVRLQVALFHRRGTPVSELTKFDAARHEFNNDLLRVAAIKLYIDDVIEPRTAAMLEPYSDRPDVRGELLYPVEEFKEVVSRLDRMKFQMFIHAIGDRGIRTALDALESARKQNGIRDSRHELVHVECLSPADIHRFRDLGVIACMQPRHCAPDITGQWAKAVGPERSKYAWAFRSLKDAGAILAFASDWNVAEMEPLIGIYTAITRKGLYGKPEGGWIPEQTIDLASAIRAYTIQSAYANFLEKNRGSITPGKYADLVMLSNNLFQIPADKIKEVQVLWTLVNGRETRVQ